MMLKEYMKVKSTSWARFTLEQVLFLFLQGMPTPLGMALRALAYRLILRAEGLFGIEENVHIAHAARLQLGRGVFIGRNSYLGASDGGIRLGDHAVILDSCYLNVFNYDDETRGVASINVGANVVLSHGCTIHGHSGIDIGDGTVVGPNTVFITGDHGRIAKETVYRTIPIERKGRTHIGRNVWIGTGVTILPGVSIGDGSVVGAGSVVTDDFPGGVVILGTPARMRRAID